MQRKGPKRRVCFVTGTRAEFGLMRAVLTAIRDHPQLELQFVVTGMHLHARHGRSIDTVRREGWHIDAVVPWKQTHSPAALSQQTGLAMSRLARTFHQLKSDIVLVVGDRVEAFAAAAAGHVARKTVAHVHGGDRAVGQIDDSLRHAITKLSHIHLAATRDSAQRLLRLGEDRWRVHHVGSPGLDGIARAAASRAELRRQFPTLRPNRFALIVLHPVAAAKADYQHADELLTAVRSVGIEQAVVIYPNNDPGAQHIIRCWRKRRRDITHLLKDVPRPVFLGLMRDAAIMVGNSSAGIIEAASFGTPVVNIGPRQSGRLRSENVRDVPHGAAAIRRAVKSIWNNGRPQHWRGENVYGGGNTGVRIAHILAALKLDARLSQKLIAY